MDDASRSRLVFLQSALEQCGERGLSVAIGFHGDVPSTVASDWNMGRIRSLEPSAGSVDFVRREGALRSARVDGGEHSPTRRE